MVTLRTLEERRSQIVALAERYRAREVRVFGSVARGDATEASDVDLLITTRDGCSLLDLGGLLEDLQDLLEWRVDLVTEDGLAEIGFEDARAMSTNYVLQPTRTSKLTIRISDSTENEYNYLAEPFVIRDSEVGGAQRIFVNPFAVTPLGGGSGRLAIDYTDSLIPRAWHQLTLNERDPIAGSVPPMYPAIDFVDTTSTNSQHRFYRARAVGL